MEADQKNFEIKLKPFIFYIIIIKLINYTFYYKNIKNNNYKNNYFISVN